jgi:hypothetical protein
VLDRKALNVAVIKLEELQLRRGEKRVLIFVRKYCAIKQACDHESTDTNLKSFIVNEVQCVYFQLDDGRSGLDLELKY